MYIGTKNYIQKHINSLHSILKTTRDIIDSYNQIILLPLNLQASLMWLFGSFSSHEDMLTRLRSESA